MIAGFEATEEDSGMGEPAADATLTLSYDPDSGEGSMEVDGELERACEDVGRDPATLRRSVDGVVDPHGRLAELSPDLEHAPITGSDEEMADAIFGFAELGVDEFRCETAGRLSDGVATIESLAGVVELVRAGG